MRRNKIFFAACLAYYFEFIEAPYLIESTIKKLKYPPNRRLVVRHEPQLLLDSRLLGFALLTTSLQNHFTVDSIAADRRFKSSALNVV